MQLLQPKDSITYTDVLNKLSTRYYELNADSIYRYAVKARDLAQRLKYRKGEADAANNLGIVEELRGNLQEALRYYTDAYNRYDELNDPPNRVQTMMNIALVYSELENPSKTMSTMRTAFAMGKNLKNDSIMAFVYSNYVTVFADRLSQDSVEYYITKAREIAERYKDSAMLLFADQLTAEKFATNNEKQKAIALLEAALQQALNDSLFYSAEDIMIDLGDNVPDSTQAATYYLRSLALSQAKGFRARVRYAYEKLFDFYETKGDDASSLLYAEKLLYYYDEQKSIDNSSGIDYTDYALKEKALATSLLRSQYQQRLLWLTLVICALFLVLILLLWRSRQRMKRTAAALKTQFVQSELTMETLDKFNKNYSRVIKVVAHDLRNPLSSIQMVSSLIEPQTMSASEISRFVNIIKTTSKSCFDLIDQLLHTDLDEENKLDKKEVALDNLLLQCMHLLSFKAKEKKQDIILSNELHPMLFVDGNKLVRVLNNLVTNAIKFSPEESLIHIKTYQIGSNLIITVADKGIGIPENLQSKIFDPFTSAKRKGTNGEMTFGLGLYISKQIVEAHGGIIWFESVPGKGTTFYIELPLKTTAQHRSLASLTDDKAEQK